MAKSGTSARFGSGLKLQYSVRRGRISASRRNALNELASRYEVLGCSLVDWLHIFGRKAPLAVEFGTGTGEHILALARNRPDIDHVAIEFYPPGMATLLRALEREGLDNVRLVRAPALGALAMAFADESISQAYVMFPDPWPKRRHRKRRLVSPVFVSLLAHRLVRDGVFTFASDNPEYVRSALGAVDESGMFEPPRPLLERAAPSRYESKALREGRAVDGFCCCRR